MDEHHTVEDCAIAIGEAIDEALGDRAGLRRFADASAPLDEALAHATVDLSGRGVARIELGSATTGSARCRRASSPTSSTPWPARGRLGLHLRAEGEDDHHRVEAAFKATALALRSAVARDPRARRRGQHEGRPVTSVALLDYGAGNLRSLRAAFERATDRRGGRRRPHQVAGADRRDLPGVGAAPPAMRQLEPRA